MLWGTSKTEKNEGFLASYHEKEDLQCLCAATSRLLLGCMAGVWKDTAEKCRKDPELCNAANLLKTTKNA